MSARVAWMALALLLAVPASAGAPYTSVRIRVLSSPGPLPLRVNFWVPEVVPQTAPYSTLRSLYNESTASVSLGIPHPYRMEAR